MRVLLVLLMACNVTIEPAAPAEGEDNMASIFRNKGARAVLQAQSSAQVARQVTTEDELRAALTPLDVTDTAALVANTGRRIVITKSITLTSSIIIDASLPGTIIEGDGMIPIFAGTDGIDAFDVRATFVTIRDLVIAGSLDGTKLFNRAVVIPSGSAASRLQMQRLVVSNAQALFEDETTSTADDLRIADCDFVEAGVAGLEGIKVNSSRFRITGTTINMATGGGLAVRANASADSGCIGTGNDFFGYGVNTSASGGLNVINGNTNAGAITNAATDAVGLNT